MQTSVRCHLYSAITILLWSYAYVGTRFVVTESDIGTSELAFIRNFVSALIFVTVLWVNKTPLPALRDIPIFFLAGGVGFVIHTITFSIGLETITGGTSSVLQSTIPLMTAAMGVVVFKEKLSWKSWGAMFIAFAGTVILSLWGGIFSVNLGTLWSLFAAACLAFYNIIQRHLPHRKVRPYDSLQITAYCFISATIISLFVLPSAYQQFAETSALVKITTVCLGIFPSAIAFVFWSKAISMTTSLATVTNYIFLTPFAVFLVCYAVLDEIPDGGTFIGGILILTGLWLFNLAMRTSQKNP